MKAFSYLRRTPILFTYYLFWFWGDNVPSYGSFGLIIHYLDDRRINY